jgi:hypothetical protein
MNRLVGQGQDIRTAMVIIRAINQEIVFAGLGRLRKVATHP